MSKLKTNEIAPYSNAGIGIGAPNVQPGAILNIQSTEQGVAVPRMTTAQRNSIPSPFNGLIIYNTDTNNLQTYNGSAWLNNSGIQTINGQNSTTQILNVGTAGTAPNISQTSTDTNTINLPLASTTGVTAGLISKTEYDTFNSKVDSGDNRLYTVKKVVVKKNPGLGEFLTLATALASITDSGEENPYIVEVGPGIYDEPELTVPTYVSIKGASINTTIIRPQAGNQNLFVMSEMVELSFMSLQGHEDSIGSGFPAILCEDVGDFAQFHKMSIYGFDIGIKISSVSAESIAYVEYVDINGDYSYAIQASSTGGNFVRCQAENFYCYETNSATKTAVLAEGTTTELLLHVVGLIGSTSGGKGVVLRNGAMTEISGSFFHDFGNSAITVENTGSASELQISGSSFKNCTKDIRVLHPGTTGYFEGYAEAAKLELNNSAPFFVTGRDSKIIVVAKEGGDYDSVKDALDSITDNSSSNPYIISIGPGTFIEDTLVSKPYVTLQGSGPGNTIIQVDATNKNIIEADISFGIKDMSLVGATDTGKCAIFVNPTSAGEEILINNVEFRNNYTFIKILVDSANSGIVNAFGITTALTVTTTEPFVCESTTGVQSLLSLDNLKSIFVNPPPDVFIGHGPGAFISSNNISIISVAGGRFVRIYDGARLIARQNAVDGFDTSIEVENVGAAPSLEVIGAVLISTTDDIIVDHPGTTGYFQGQADSSKITINSSSTIRMNYIDSIDPIIGSITLGEILQGDRHDRLLSISKLTRETSPTGTYTGGVISAVSGLDISVTGGAGFVLDPVGQYLKEVTWSTGTITLAANSSLYIYITDTGTITSSAAQPNIQETLILGRVSTYASTINFIDKSAIRNDHLGNKIGRFQREAIGSIFASGSLVSENGTRGLDVSSGIYYFGNTRFTPSGGTAISWEYRYRNGSGGYSHGTQSTVDNGFYDNGTGTLAALTASYYAKHAFYVSGDGSEEKYHLVYSQAQYSSLVLAEAADIPIPPTDFTEGVTLIATFIVQQGVANISEVRDERPIIGFKASGVSATADHGNLFGLADDDHPQYLLVNGSRAMTGSLNMGTNAITNVGTVDGVTVSAHASRHLPNGSDALTTAAPTANLTATTTNSVGIQNSLARSDHSHAITTGVVSGQTPDQTNAAGTSASLARADHVHNIPTAAPNSTIGANSTNSQGILANFSRSDHGHQVATGVVSTQTPDQANAAGSSNNLARADHVHQIATASAVALSTSSTNTQGSASSFSRSDHTHAVTITNVEVSATAAATTTSATDVLMTSMTSTPAAGTYLAIFSCWVTSSSAGAEIGAGIYVGGSGLAHTDRQSTPRATTSGAVSDSGVIATNALVTVNGSQAVEIRWRTSAGTATVNDRTLNLIKLA